MSELREIREKSLINVTETIEQNRDKIEEAYEWMMRLEYKTRREGLLALEYEVGYIPKEMPLCDQVIEMVKLICDGTEPKVLAEYMTLKFMANNYTGLDALLFFLYARSMLMIQAGMNVVQIEELFCSVASGTSLRFHRRRDIWEEDSRQKIEFWKNTMKETHREILQKMSKQLQEISEEEWKIIVSSNGFYGFDKILPYLDETAQTLARQHMNGCRYYVIMTMPSEIQEQELKELEEELTAYITDLQRRLRGEAKRNGALENIIKSSDEEIQMILRECDNTTVIYALKGVDEQVAECFFRNMSIRARHMVQEDMEYLGPVRMRDVQEAQDKIYQVGKTLLGW